MPPKPLKRVIKFKNGNCEVTAGDAPQERDYQEAVVLATDVLGDNYSDGVWIDDWYQCIIYTEVFSAA
jgi:hypothetical protein